MIYSPSDFIATSLLYSYPDLYNGNVAFEVPQQVAMHGSRPFYQILPPQVIAIVPDHTSARVEFDQYPKYLVPEEQFGKYVNLRLLPPSNPTAAPHIKIIDLSNCMLASFPPF